MLGTGNEKTAQEALKAWPSGLQIGGGITAENANLWVERGAGKVEQWQSGLDGCKTED